MSNAAGYSSTPLYRKLGLKPGFSCIFLRTIDGFEDLIDPILNEVNILENFENNSADFIIHFVTTKSELEADLQEILFYLKKTGMLWVCWPKGASKIPTNLNRDFIRNYILNTSLVDVKVAAIDENWSGLKFVYRLKDR